MTDQHLTHWRGVHHLALVTAEYPSELPRDTVVREASRRGRILVVDDEPMIAVAIRRTLQRDHEVVTLTSAREAHAREPTPAPRLSRVSSS